MAVGPARVMNSSMCLQSGMHGNHVCKKKIAEIPMCTYMRDQEVFPGKVLSTNGPASVHPNTHISDYLERATDTVARPTGDEFLDVPLALQSS